MLKNAIPDALRIHKVKHYFEAYDFHFAPLVNNSITLLEIGVGRGGSLVMWRNYFNNGRVVGIDNNPACKACAGDRIEIHIGDQADEQFLNSLMLYSFDIIVDDGGHTMEQQLASFKTLFPTLNDGGIYVIEDLCTSYWPSWGAHRERAFIDFLKFRVDTLNMWAARHEEAGEYAITKPPDIFEKMMSSIHFYNGIVFIYKKGHAFCPKQGKDVFAREDF